MDRACALCLESSGLECPKMTVTHWKPWVLLRSGVRSLKQTVKRCETKRNVKLSETSLTSATTGHQDMSFPQRSQLRFECARLLRFARFVDLLIAETLVTTWKDSENTRNDSKRLETARNESSKSGVEKTRKCIEVELMQLSVLEITLNIRERPTNSKNGQNLGAMGTSKHIWELKKCVINIWTAQGGGGSFQP